MNRALIVILIFITACKQSDKTPDIEFDQVTHYTIQMEDQQLFELASQDSINDLEQLKVDLLLNKSPESLSDTLFIENLEAIGFTKTQMNANQVRRLQNLLSIEKNQTNKVHDCMNIYRDILVLKQDNKTTGIAKVCLECEAIKLTGTKRRVFNLSKTDYNTLEHILKK